MYSEQDLRHAAEFRDGIHREALARVKAVCPAAEDVVDRYPVDAYFQNVWDYPGKWYTVVGTPEGAGSRKALMESIVRDTLASCRKAGAEFTDEVSYKLIAEYPDVVCDYYILSSSPAVGQLDSTSPAAGRSAATEDVSPFPYRGVDSHRLALGLAARELLGGENDWSCDVDCARCKKLKDKALFAPEGSDQWLNYRKAFLSPPHENAYTDDDFDRVNAVLFPGGADGLEIFRWTTDWSDYFDEGHEWWGALCLTVYDRTLDRFVVILASATD